ncbi:hypothetical protein [Actinomadura sediminis]|uniref:Transposase n=1 Tax=Actinomadura sediminis TaxID=1038904 RepID=A0ABW3EPR8_9ACTN
MRHLPRDSATARAILGPAAEWTDDTHLLAHLVDLTSGANWQRGGGKGSKPKPLKRPRPST